MVGRITIKINTIVNNTTITNTIKIYSPGCLRWWPSHRPLQPVQSSIELNVKILRFNLVISSFNAINTMCIYLETLRSSGLNLVTSSSTSHLDSVVSSFTTSHSLRSLLSEIEFLQHMFLCFVALCFTVVFIFGCLRFHKFTLALVFSLWVVCSLKFAIFTRGLVARSSFLLQLFTIICLPTGAISDHWPVFLVIFRQSPTRQWRPDWWWLIEKLQGHN